MRTVPHAARPWILAVALALVAGCSTVPERRPLPEALSDLASIPGIEGGRFWGDALPPDVDEQIEAARNRVEASAQAGVDLAPPTFLALSGGGADGAFGAGVLAGWTESGTRPEFSVVTGISTGALIAPFAFLGPEYDDELRKLYTQTSTDDILELRLASAAFGDSVVSSEPLARLIAKYIDETVMAAIALEFYKGRGLLVGTTNLDAGRPVIWSIGAIAASGAPNALDLIRDILRASASIPGAFPPVYVDVEANGETYDEMHVDGGTASQVFLYPVALDFRSLMRDVGLDVDGARMFVIRNSRLEPQWAAVNPNVVAISERSVNTLIATQGIGDLYRIYLGAGRDGIDYNLAYIPPEFDHESEELFDPGYMNALFEVGYAMAKHGYPWAKAPPGFAPPTLK